MLPSLVSPKYRRLWKRRLRRRPLLPFLLVCLLVLDAVAVVAMPDTNPRHIDMLLLGGVIAQLNLLGIWIGSRRFGVLPRLGYAMVLVALLTVAFEWTLPDPPGAITAFFTGIFALSALVAGLSEAIALRWRKGIRRTYRWRFSIGFLLLATTLVPLLLTASAVGQWQVFINPAVAVPFSIEILLVAIAIAIQHGVRTAKRTAAIYLGMTVPIIFICFSLESHDHAALLSPGYYSGLLLCLGGFMTAIKVRGKSRLAQVEKSEDQPAPPTPEVESIDLRG